MAYDYSDTLSGNLDEDKEIKRDDYKYNGGEEGKRHNVPTLNDFHNDAKTIAAQKSNDVAGKAKATAKASSAMGGGSKLAQAISGALGASRATSDAYTSGYDTGLSAAQQRAQMDQQQKQFERQQQLNEQKMAEQQYEYEQQLALQKQQLEEAKAKRLQDMWTGIGNQTLNVFRDMIKGYYGED